MSPPILARSYCALMRGLAWFWPGAVDWSPKVLWLFEKKPDQALALNQPG
ncbi:MAG: hypothetical protein WCK05_11695 [Planctomycetota bacterium]